jgi:antitoxin ParD1/3/4
MQDCIGKAARCPSLAIFDKLPSAPQFSNTKDVPMGVNINLTPELEEMVRRKAASGRYNSTSEVVREALRLMEEQDQVHAVRIEQLRADIRKGLDGGPGEPWDAEALKRQAHARRSAKAAAGAQVARIFRRPQASEDIAGPGTTSSTRTLPRPTAGSTDSTSSRGCWRRSR